MKRQPGLGWRRSGSVAIAMLGLSLAPYGSPALGAPYYQLTDLGDVPAPIIPPAFATGQVVYNAEIETPRINDQHQITNDRLVPNYTDSTALHAIQAPYTAGSSGLFPTMNGGPYQVGYVASTSPTSPWQAMLWNNQTQTGQALGPVPGPSAWTGLGLSGSPNSGWYSLGLGVNDQGIAVGSVGNGSQSRAAMTWGMSGDPLASVRSQLGSYSQAFAINNQNEIVGTFGSFTDPHAFLFANGTLIDLNTVIPPHPGLTLLAATGINDLGEIVGVAADANGKAHEFLLTSEPMLVPEPTTLSVFGLLALGLFARRLRRQG